MAVEAARKDEDRKVEANRKYEATVSDAYITESTKKGSLGLYFLYLTPDGIIEHTFYVSPGTRVRLAENLAACFGITEAQLLDWNFLLNIGDALRNQPCSITTEEEEYEGKLRVKVAWMNPAGSTAKKIDDQQKLRRVAGLFGGGPVSSPAYRGAALLPRETAPPPPGAELNSDDVPF